MLYVSAMLRVPIPGKMHTWQLLVNEKVAQKSQACPSHTSAGCGRSVACGVPRLDPHGLVRYLGGNYNDIPLGDSKLFPASRQGKCGGAWM